MKTIIRKQFAALLVSLFAVQFLQAQSFFSRINGNIGLFPSAQSLSAYTTVPLQKVATTTQEAVTLGMQNVMQNPGGSFVGGALGYGFYKNAEFALNPEFSTTYPITSRLFGMSAFVAGGVFGSCHLQPGDDSLFNRIAAVYGVGCLLGINALNRCHYNQLKSEIDSKKNELEEEVKRRNKEQRKTIESTAVNQIREETLLSKFDQTVKEGLEWAKKNNYSAEKVEKLNTHNTPECRKVVEILRSREEAARREEVAVD